MFSSMIAAAVAAQAAAALAQRGSTPTGLQQQPGNGLRPDLDEDERRKRKRREEESSSSFVSGLILGEIIGASSNSDSADTSSAPDPIPDSKLEAGGGDFGGAGDGGSW